MMRQCYIVSTLEYYMWELFSAMPTLQISQFHLGQAVLFWYKNLFWGKFHWWFGQHYFCNKILKHIVRPSTNRLHTIYFRPLHIRDNNRKHPKLVRHLDNNVLSLKIIEIKYYEYFPYLLHVKVVILRNESDDGISLNGFLK